MDDDVIDLTIPGNNSNNNNNINKSNEVIEITDDDNDINRSKSKSDNVLTLRSSYKESDLINDWLITPPLYLIYLQEDIKNIVIGVDVGELYFIVSIYEILVEKKMVDSYRIQLRQKGEKPKKYSEMMLILKSFYDTHKILWNHVLHCYSEGQFKRKINVDLENLFNGIIAPIPTTRIQTISVRCKFKVLNNGIEKGMSKHTRRRIHKENSVIFGKSITTKECNNKLKKDDRQHDYYEGGIFAKYGFEKYLINK